MTNFPSELIDGYCAFKGGSYLVEKETFETLAEHGQKPSTLIISCCDSRAAPEMIFNASPGDIFIVRNVANLVQPFSPDGGYQSTSAALEFAVQALKVKNIVVMGHGQCGGVKAALDPNMEPLSSGDFIGHWISLLKPAANELLNDHSMSAAERQTALEHRSIRDSIDALRSFPWIKDLEDDNQLHLAGGLRHI